MVEANVKWDQFKIVILMLIFLMGCSHGRPIVLMPSVAGIEGTPTQFKETGAVGEVNVVGNPPILFDLTNPATTWKRAIGMTIHQRFGSGQINVGGILIEIYTQPDNGGDVSGIWVRQTGGGNAISAYNLSGDRPAGFEEYDRQGYAIEAGSDGLKNTIVSFSHKGWAYLGYMKDDGGGIRIIPFSNVNPNQRAYQITDSTGMVERFGVTLDGKIISPTIDELRQRVEMLERRVQ